MKRAHLLQFSPRWGYVSGKATATYERLVSDQYPELNAALYASNPSDYLRARLQGILHMMQEDPDQEEPTTGVRIGMLEVGPMPYLSEDDRLRYAAMDTSVLVHHAGETLVRLWLAHKD